jgi:hypothetical protein
MMNHCVSLLLVPTLWIATAALGEDKPADTTALVMREMELRVATLRVSLDAPEARAACAFVEKPLLRYSDPARETVDGTLWLWTYEGRPAALLCLFTEPADWKGWNYEWTSFSDQPLHVTGRPWWTWTPRPAKGDWLAAAADPPADSETTRLLQMRSIARRFTAQETLRGEPYVLRLLARPLHRYSAPRQGVIDGALFAHAYGTNPDLLLQVEARRSGDDEWTWHVRFARASAARVAVLEDGREVWSRPELRAFQPDEPYYSAFGPDVVAE